MSEITPTKGQRRRPSAKLKLEVAVIAIVCLVAGLAIGYQQGVRSGKQQSAGMSGAPHGMGAGMGGAMAAEDDPHAGMDMGSMGPAKGSGGMSMTAEDIEKAFKQFDSMDDLIALGNQHLDEARGEAGDISAESAEQRFMIAVGAYERALELEPGDANIITDLGIAYRRLGDPKMAVEKFREAAAADPDHVQSRFNAGLVLEADLEDMTGAAEAWKDYLEVAPKDDSRREEIEAKLRDMN